MKLYHVHYHSKQQGTVVTPQATLYDMAAIPVLDALDIDRASELAIGEQFGGLVYTVRRVKDEE